MAKLLSAVAEKAIVKLKESGALVDFYVAKHDYESGLNGTGRTLLARAEPWPTDIVWNNIRENAYADSTIDRWMNNDYKNKLDPSIQAQITETQFYYTEGNGSRKTVPLSRDIFILSGTEYGISADRMMTEGEILPIADELLSTRENEWTRSPRYNLTTSAWRCAKDISTAYEADVTYAFPARPVFQLPSTLTVSDDGVIIAPPLAPDSIAVPDTTMQGNTLPVSWTAADGADSYVLERSADSGAWTQVYSGAELSHTDTAGTWSTVQYRVKAGVSGVYGDYATSAAVAVVPASTCTISGEDGDLGTLTGDIVYTAMTSTSEPITVTETVNGTALRTFQPVSGAQQRISVMDLPTGGGTAVIQAECSGVSVTRTWTYTKAAADFPAAPTPFDIALLSKGGRVQFPQTLAECVRMPGGERLGDVLSTRIGDTLTTARKDLGSSWLLCNGDNITKAEFPDLYEVLSESQGNTGFNTAEFAKDIDQGYSDLRMVGVAYGNGYYVVVAGVRGDKRFYLFWTADGVVWDQKEYTYSGNISSPCFPTKIRFINGTFVVCGKINNNPIILCATDPNAGWTQTTLDSDSNLYAVDVAYKDGLWGVLATNDSAYLFIFKNDLSAGSWKKQTIVTGSSNSIKEILCGDDCWVACGKQGSSSIATVWTNSNIGSPDKASWTAKNLPGAEKGYSICQGGLFADGRYVLYGRTREPAKATVWYGASIDALVNKEISSDPYDFVEGAYSNGALVLCTSNNDLKQVFAGEGVNPDNFTRIFETGERCDYVASAGSGFVLLSDSNRKLYLAWNSANVARLPLITNYGAYTYIKAR